MKQPNFLIIMVDQMTGTLLNPDMIEHLHIPNLRRLMDRGVTFDNTYCGSPLCTPARGSFMNGQLPSKTGIYDNAAEFTSTTPTFAHYLRHLGYQTALSGKMHFVGADQLHGFEERLTTDIYPADFGWTPDWKQPLERIDWWYHNLSSVTEAGIAEISNQLEFDDETAYFAKLKLYQYARRKDTRPFCLTVSFTHPHDPYVTRQKYWDLYDHDAIPMPTVAAMGYAEQDSHSQRLYDAVDYTQFDVSDADIRNARHAYFANISYLDDKLGELLQVLDDGDFTDNTVVVFTGDHGDMLGERGLWYKMSFFENSMRIPFIISDPRSSQHGSRLHTPVSQVDLLPTLIDLSGANGRKLACDIDGQSVVPLLQNGEDDSRLVKAEYCAEGSVAPMIMLRQGNYKYTYCEADGVQLFDLSADPNELNNLASDSNVSEVEQHFQTLRQQHWDLTQFKADVMKSQACRQLVASANRKGHFTAWDYQPVQESRNRYMRNHLDLNVLEEANRYPKKL